MKTIPFNAGFIATHGNIVAYGCSRTEAMTLLAAVMGVFSA